MRPADHCRSVPVVSIIREAEKTSADKRRLPIASFRPSCRAARGGAETGLSRCLTPKPRLVLRPSCDRTESRR